MTLAARVKKTARPASAKTSEGPAHLKTTSPIVLIGVEISFAADVIDTLARLRIPIAAGIVNGPLQWSLRGTPVVLQPGDISADLPDLPAVICASGPQSRKKLRKRAVELGFKAFPAIIDPTAIVPESGYMTRGIFINAGAVLGGGAELDEFALVNRAATIGHHCVVEAFSTVGPGAVLTSGIKVGPGAMIGAGSVIANNVKIREGARVAAGAVVLRDVEPGQTVLGNPARPAMGSRPAPAEGQD